MMNQWRFLLLSVAVFAVAFAGMTYASRGLLAFMPSFGAPELVTASAPQTRDATAEAEAPLMLAAHRPEPVVEEPAPPAGSPSPSDADPRWMRRQEIPVSAPASIRNAPLPLPRPATKPFEREVHGSPLRRTALQAATAFAAAPCDAAAKAAFIVSASSYMRTHDGAPDAELQRAMQWAVTAGNVRADEFASGAPEWVRTTAGGRVRGCETNRRVAQR